MKEAVEVYVPMESFRRFVEKPLLKLFSREGEARPRLFFGVWPKAWKDNRFVLLPTPSLLWGNWGKGSEEKRQWADWVKENLPSKEEGIHEHLLLLAPEEEEKAPDLMMKDFLNFTLGLNLFLYSLRYTRAFPGYVRGKTRVKIIGVEGRLPGAAAREKEAAKAQKGFSLPDPMEVYKGVWDVLSPHKGLQPIAPLPESHIAILLASGFIPPGIKVSLGGKEVETLCRTVRETITSPIHSYRILRNGEEIHVEERKWREAYALRIYVNEGERTYLAFPEEERGTKNG